MLRSKVNGQEGRKGRRIINFITLDCSTMIHPVGHFFTYVVGEKCRNGTIFPVGYLKKGGGGKKNLKKNQKWSRLIGDLKVGQSAHFLLASSPSNQILLHFALDGPVCYFLFSKQ